MTDCSCASSRSAIHFRDSAGINMMFFLRLCGGDRFFGGKIRDEVRLVPAAQMWITLAGMLDLIASLAKAKDSGYQVAGNDWTIFISRQMRADDIARVLGCDPQTVIDHFALLVTLDPED